MAPPAALTASESRSSYCKVYTPGLLTAPLTYTFNSFAVLRYPKMELLEQWNCQVLAAVLGSGVVVSSNEECDRAQHQSSYQNRQAAGYNCSIANNSHRMDPLRNRQLVSLLKSDYNLAQF